MAKPAFLQHLLETFKGNLGCYARQVFLTAGSRPIFCDLSGFADFLQHMEPKIWTESLAPATWPEDPEKEWCPPGHGDIYTALVASGNSESASSHR